MAGNTFGQIFRATTFGESHGGAVGVVVDGVPPRLPLDVLDIQKQLDRRKPGQSSVTTPRKEPDTVHILAGVFEGQTTGMPVFMVLYNQDTRSQDYHNILDLFRPGHADYTYDSKYGIRDYRGSGRASGRETAGRVAAGAIARKLLEKRGISVQAYSKQIGNIVCPSFDPDFVEKNPVRTGEPEAARKMEELIISLAEEGDSIGGIVECRVQGLPAGLGEPVFGKLDAEIAGAMLSIGAVKGIEFGTGFDAAVMRGSEHNDAMGPEGFLTNHAGGILGGISTGAELVFRIVVKPTASINAEQDTVNKKGESKKISTEGRHDPCICPRIIPVVEAMVCLVLEDQYRRHAAQMLP